MAGLRQEDGKPLEWVKLSTLKHHPDNPRRGNVEAIRESLRVNGVFRPIVVSRKTRHVLAGNHTLKAARAESLDALPVVWLDDLTPAQERKVLLADNRTSDLGDYDNDLLGAILGQMRAEDELLGTGYSDADVEALLAESLGEPSLDELEDAPEAKEDKSAELQRKWNTARGQLWTVGKHRLMCGDSTSPTDVARLLGGGKVDLLLTDPPYGVSYADKNAFLNAVGRGNHIQTPIENDHMSVDDTGALWDKVFTICNDVMKDGACYYMTGPHIGDLSLMMMMMIQKSGLLLKHILIWSKNQMVLGRSDYHYKHEPILYGWKPGAAHYYGGESNETSIWDCNKPHAAKLHPTMKPVELFARAVKNGSRAGEVVFDPFMGSGTTAVACEQLGRRARGMELSPAYLAVQLERLSEMGLVPTLEP